MESIHVDRAARESELSVSRSSREALGRDVRTREHELAGVVARLKSLEELDAARAEYGDGARIILAESGDAVPQLGSVADYIEVDQRSEEHTSELQSPDHLVCRLLLEKKKNDQ